MPKITDARKKAKRDTIIHAAVTLFSRKGFHGTNTAQIAAHAKVAEGTIFRYFHSKDDLLIQAFIAVMERLGKEVFEDDDPALPASERIIRFIRHHIRLAHEHPDLARFLIIELRQNPEFLARYPEYRPLNEYLDRLRALCQEGVDKGEFRPIDVDLLVSILFGTMDFVLTHWYLSHGELDLEAVLKTVRDIIYNGIKPEAK